MYGSLKDKLNAIGVEINEQASNLIVVLNNDGILFEIIVDEFNDECLKEELVIELKHHFNSIETEDEEYFYDCDAEYLKGEWKQLLLDINNVIK